jgi:hypothetical protein
MPGAAVPVLGAAKTLRRIPAVRLRRSRGYGAEQHDRGQGAQKRFHDVTFGRCQTLPLVVAKLCVDNARGSLRVPENTEFAIAKRRHPGSLSAIKPNRANQLCQRNSRVTRVRRAHSGDGWADIARRD